MKCQTLCSPEGSELLGDANRHFVACPAKTNPSAETGDAGTYDNDIHDFGWSDTITAILQEKETFR
jgi:hypothetical protein